MYRCLLGFQSRDGRNPSELILNTGIFGDLAPLLRSEIELDGLVERSEGSSGSLVPGLRSESCLLEYFQTGFRWFPVPFVTLQEAQRCAHHLVGRVVLAVAKFLAD